MKNDLGNEELRKDMHIDHLARELDQVIKLLRDRKDKLSSDQIEYFKNYQHMLGTQLTEMMLVD